ncbi:hypothetical protein O4215_25030 [Rhodococcus maanshanensis]|uniref:DUF2231 domain-containing protein n=1 Tax=Rhodococcus maanshanensis TaxID=183556 RepID=UPI0022B31D3C|nr:DUF2231 domain-containing protein [Rhodococcus maanshanensis]MCZ4558831.1 hypothetical protein [Rhodococcus maanshanensis]
MSTINGLPVHVLLNHFIVVLAPLTAILVILCSAWPAARRRLVWPTLVLAAAVTALTPVTTEAGEWLERHVDSSPAVHTHTELGDTMIYFSVALLVVAVALAVVHLREERSMPAGRVLTGAVVAVAVIVGLATIVQVYRIGESGARSVWGDQITSAPADAGR